MNLLTNARETTGLSQSIHILRPGKPYEHRAQNASPTQLLAPRIGAIPNRGAHASSILYYHIGNTTMLTTADHALQRSLCNTHTRGYRQALARTQQELAGPFGSKTHISTRQRDDLKRQGCRKLSGASCDDEDNIPTL